MFHGDDAGEDLTWRLAGDLLAWAEDVIHCQCLVSLPNSIPSLEVVFSG